MLPNGRYCAFAGTKAELANNRQRSRFLPTGAHGKWLWINMNGNDSPVDDRGNKIDLSKISWVCFNPFNPDSQRKRKGDVLERRAVTIEYDNLPLAEQRRRLAKVPYTVLCYSGSKSIHAHIIFTGPLDAVESRKIDALLSTLFGDSDSSTWRINQLVRVPGGWNYDTNKEQTIENFREPIAPEKFLEWLEAEAKNAKLEPVSIPPEQQVKPENKARFAFIQWVLDRELVGKSGYRKAQSEYNGEPGMAYWSNCPLYHEHTDEATTRTEFNIFLTVAGDVKKHCFHNTHKNIWQVDFEKLLGFRIVTADNLTAWFATENFARLGLSPEQARAAILPGREAKDQGQAPAQDEIEEGTTPATITENFDVARLADVEQKIQDTGKKKYLLFSAPTGVGKTVLMVRRAIDLAKAGKEITFFTDSINSVRDVVGEFALWQKIKGAEDIHVTKNISGMQKPKAGEKKTDIRESIGQIAISTYAYLGSKGMMPQVYSIAEKLIAGRVVFCDEIGELFRRMQVLLDLACRMIKRKNTMCRLRKCPASSGVGSCEICYLAYLRQDPEQQTNYRNFYPAFPYASLKHHQAQPDLGILPRDIFEPATYTQADKTLFTRDLQENYSTETEIVSNPEADSLIEYIGFLMKYLAHPHLRMNHPILKKTELQIATEEITENKNAVTLPIGCCAVPYLAGINILPLLQLLQADSLGLTSATVPQEFTEIFSTIAEKVGWSGECMKITDIPYQFNLAQLNTCKRLSSATAVKAISKMDELNRPEKGLHIAGRDVEADEFEELANKQGLDFSRFSKRKFRWVTEAAKNKTPKHIATNARGALARGANLPGYQYMIIDCQQHLPKLALAYRGDDLKKAMLEEINENCLQLLGRVLRSNLKQVPGETVIDTRPIVVIFHGLPEGFKPKLDGNLFYSHQEINETWLPIGGKKEVQAVVDAITAALDGKPVPDAREAEKKTLAKKGNSALSKKQRSLSAGHKQETKSEKREEETIRKVMEARELYSKGTSKREISRKFNLARMSENERINFLELVVTDNPVIMK